MGGGLVHPLYLPCFWAGIEPHTHRFRKATGSRDRSPSDHCAVGQSRSTPTRPGNAEVPGQADRRVQARGEPAAQLGAGPAARSAADTQDGRAPAEDQAARHHCARTVTGPQDPVALGSQLRAHLPRRQMPLPAQTSLRSRGAHTPPHPACPTWPATNTFPGHQSHSLYNIQGSE